MAHYLRLESSLLFFFFFFYNLHSNYFIKKHWQELGSASLACGFVEPGVPLHLSRCVITVHQHKPGVLSLERGQDAPREPAKPSQSQLSQGEFVPVGQGGARCLACDGHPAGHPHAMTRGAHEKREPVSCFVGAGSLANGP